MSTEVILKEVEDFKAIIHAAPVALQKGIRFLESAIAKGDNLRARIQNGEMDDSLDQELNDHMAKLKEVKEKVYGSRTPFTKMFDNFKSRFTGIEKSFDQEYELFQKERDAYAAKLRAEQQERDRQAALKLAKEKERIDYRFKIEEAQRLFFEGKLKLERDRLFNAFNGITLDNYDKGANYFKTYTAIFEEKDYALFNTVIGSSILNPDECNEIVRSVSSPDKFSHFKDAYVCALTDAVQEIKDKLPGKKAQLDEIKASQERAAEAAKQAAAAKSETDRLAAEAAKKKAEEEAENQRIGAAAEAKAAEEKRIAEEKAAAAKAAEAAEIEKEAAVANTLFDHAIENAELSSNVAKGREGYEITVNAPDGWKYIFMQWWEVEGNKLTVEAIGKKKFDSMKTACEKHAHKTGEKIDSKLLTYTEVFKTSVVKS